MKDALFTLLVAFMLIMMWAFVIQGIIIYEQCTQPIATSIDGGTLTLTQAQVDSYNQPIATGVNGQPIITNTNIKGWCIK